MLTFQIQKHVRANGLLVALLFTLASAVTAVGCGSTKNPVPDGGDRTTGTAGTTGGAGTTGAGGTTGGGGTTGSAGTTGAAGNTDGGTDGNPDTSSPDASNPDTSGTDGPVGYPGCFPGTPADRQAGSVQFLNKCTGTNCFPFDNAARLPRYNGGQLPALPQ